MSFNGSNWLYKNWGPFRYGVYPSYMASLNGHQLTASLARLDASLNGDMIEGKVWKCTCPCYPDL